MTHLPAQLARKLLNHTNARGLLAVAICGASTLAITPAAALADDSSASFWTQFAPSQDTRLIFVSSSEGDDNNSGLNPNEPVASLERAYDLIRDGYPDWMLMKRGDVWYESFPVWRKSGRAENEKLVVGAYGSSDERPQVRPAPNDIGLRRLGNEVVSHVAFVGFHLEPQDRPHSGGADGINWIRNSEDILFEDIYIDGFATNVNLQARNDVEILDLRFNGCVIVDAWNNDGHSQGLFAFSINGLTIENSVFDHNGWNEDMGAGPTIFNHNIYIQGYCDNVEIKDCVIADASSHGVHFRAGGILSDNLFLLNPISIDLGGGTGTSVREGGVEYQVTDNTVMEGRALDNDAPRSWGISVKNTKQGMISGNILANAEATPYNVFALRLADPADGTFGIGFHDLTIEHNYFVGWPGSLKFYAPTADQPYSNVVVRNNKIYRDLSTRDAAVCWMNWSPNGELLLESNKYYVANPTNAPFTYLNSNVNFDSWSSDVESSATMRIVDSLDRLSIDDFMSQHGHSGDARDYVDTMRTLSRQNTLPELRPQSVYNWAIDEIQAMQ